jgi:hypothetical protein
MDAEVSELVFLIEWHAEETAKNSNKNRRDWISFFAWKK